MFLWSTVFTFTCKHSQRIDNSWTSLFWFDYNIYEATFCSFVRSCEFFYVLSCFSIFIFIFFEDNVSCTSRTHYSDFGCRPSVYLISAQILGTHSEVRTTICFTSDNSNFWYCCFRVSIQHFSTMTNDTAPFLICARQETRNVNEVNDWNIESITETDETGRFVGCIDVQATSHYFWLVSNDTNGLTVKTCETCDNVCSIEWLYFIVFAIIYSSCDNIFHVVRHVAVIR